MKRVFGLICAGVLIVICWTAVSFAGFTLPPEVYRIGALKEVEAKARSTNVPIVFLYSDVNSSCGLARKATLDVVEKLKDHALIIYISRNDTGIPSPVIKAMNSPAAGRFIPKTVAVNPKTGQVAMVIPYIADRDQRIAEIKKVKDLMRK
jgi:hypothetical protein